MRMLMIAATLTLLTAAPLFAQDTGGADAKGYVSGLGGFAASVTSTSSDLLVEGGIRIAPHVMVFGNVGRFSDLRGDLQPTLDATTAALTANDGLTVIGGGNLPATYASGGLRVEIPINSRVMPYVLGGIGVAHLSPSPQFLFSSGLMPDGSSPAIGANVTTAIVAAGEVTPPAASNALMLTVGAGMQFPVAPHWVVDGGYRYSHIGSDATLSATPLSANGITFGIGYRF